MLGDGTSQEKPTKPAAAESKVVFNHAPTAKWHKLLGREPKKRATRPEKHGEENERVAWNTAFPREGQRPGNNRGDP